MGILSRFGTDQSGATATIFAVTLVPILGLAGASLDYSRAASFRAALQTASDSTALMLAHEAGGNTEAQLQAKGRAYFDGLMPPRYRALVGDVAVRKTPRTVEVAAGGDMDAAILPVIGIKTMPVAAGSTVQWGVRRIELALVLDNTGSMASAGKLTELKKASKSLLDALAAVAAKAEPGSIKVSLVPFATQVMVPTSEKNAAWLDFGNATLKTALRTTKGAWTGCISDRDDPYDTGDVAPSTSAPKTLYPAAKCQYGTLQTVRPLTDDFNGLKASIDGMTANGNTNITIGIAHGLSTLSPGLPYGGAVAFGDKDTDKFMIVLTDGDNTENRFGDSVAKMNQRTRAACETAKSTANGVRLYTIRVINGNASLLRDCASTTDMYYDVSNAAELNPVFQKIAGEIAAIRLTH